MTEITPERVKEDSDLNQAEKETNILFDKTSDDVRISTAEGGLMRRLIQHPSFEINSITEKDGNIVNVVGTMPIGVISIGQSERKQKGHSGLITNGVMRTEENASINLQ